MQEDINIKDALLVMEKIKNVGLILELMLRCHY